MKSRDVAVWAAGAVMVLALVPDARGVGLGAAAVAALAVVLARSRRWAATIAVQVVVAAIAFDGTSVTFAVLAGVSATAFLLATHLRTSPDLLAPVLARVLPVMVVTTLVALIAALVPLGSGQLAALAPLAVAGLYAITVLPYGRRSQP